MSSIDDIIIKLNNSIELLDHNKVIISYTDKDVIELYVDEMEALIVDIVGLYSIIKKSGIMINDVYKDRLYSNMNSLRIKYLPIEAIIDYTLLL